MYMNYFIKRNSLVLLLIIFTLALSITSSPISVLKVLAKSDNASDGGGSDNGDNGKGHDKGGGSDDSNDGGSDDSNDGGSDDSNDGGSDDSNDGGSDDSNDGGSDDSNDGGSDDSNDGGSDDSNDGGSDDSNDGGSDDSNDGASQSSESNFQTDTKNKQNNNVNKIVSPIVDQTLKDKYGSKVFYVLINSADNKTIFVPEKVTLTTGSTVVWLNQDSSDHMITVGSNSKSEYALLNSLILPGGMVDQKFQSAG